ncbi:MAG: cell division protein ZapA [Desulfovibrionaceae bacterium]|nr:cell division protein ZapA [Desulfovibrionaceae bacterium]
MSESAQSVNVLGVINLRFPPNALERAQKAVQLLEERLQKQKERSRGQSKEAELACVALGLADDLLQQESKMARLDEKVEAILEKIKNST